MIASIIYELLVSAGYNIQEITIYSATYGVEIEPIKTRRKDKIQQNFNKIVAQAFKAKFHLIYRQI